MLGGWRKQQARQRLRESGHTSKGMWRFDLGGASYSASGEGGCVPAEAARDMVKLGAVLARMPGGGAGGLRMVGEG